MGIYYDNWQKSKQHGTELSQVRYRQQEGEKISAALRNHFRESSLLYLDENVINYLADSLVLEKHGLRHSNFSDFSFLTAPAYKAFEGFLFQIAKDLSLPSSGRTDFIGQYFDEGKVDKTIDMLIRELEKKGEASTKLGKQEKENIKDNVKEMKRFLLHYRHTPAHFHGEPMISVEKAKQITYGIYRIIDETI